MSTPGLSDPNFPPSATLDPLLLLAARGSEGSAVDAIATHFYRGIDRFTWMHQTFDNPFHQLWACAEELQLLFDAEAIWLRSASAWVRSNSEAVSEVASLTQREKEVLKPFLWADKAIEDAVRQRSGPVTWVQLPVQLGAAVAGLANSNLVKATSWLRIAVDAPDGPWEMALVLPSKDRLPVRRATEFCEWLLDPKYSDRIDALLAGLRTVRVPFGSLKFDREPLWKPDREQLSEDLKDLPLGTFLNEYSARMKPMHAILNALHAKFARLIERTLGKGAATPTIIFSYRKSSEDCICFMPTDEQAEQFVDKREKIADFLEFCRFPYPRDKALSGWVLSTGMCDYTENFDQDGRWAEWLESSEGVAIRAQLERVKRFLQRDRSLPHVYLVPIVLAPSRSEDGLETILMASISVAAPLPMEARRELFDLAVGMRPAVEFALGAQQDLDLTREKMEAPVEKEGKWSLLQKQLAWGLGIITGLLTLFLGYQSLKPTIINPPPPSIVLGENPIPLSAMTILATRGDYFGRYHLKATTAPFATGRDALDALLAGDAQFVTVAETPLVFAAFAQQKLAVVATMAESAKEMQLVVNSDKIHTLADLKGKTLATALGTNADYFTDAFLQHNGLARSQMKVLNLKPAEMVDAFAKGSIDGYFVWQPFVYKGLHLANIHAAAYTGSDYYTMTFNIVTSQDFLAKHPDQVESFLRALKDAEEEIKRNPTEGEDAVEEKSHISREVLDELWPNYTFGLKLDDSLLKYLSDQGTWVQTSAAYKGKPMPDLRGMLAPAPLEAVKPGSVSLH